MPLLPFTDCTVPEPPPTECAWLAAAGNEILSAALDGLAPFIPPTSGPCADTFETYLTMGPPVAEFYDALSVHLETFGPTPSAVRAREATSCPSGLFPQQQARWVVTLMENCWPPARREGETIHVPPPEDLNAAAEWSYAHGIAMYEAVVTAMVKNSWEMPTQVTSVVVGDLKPVGPQPQGLAVGWRFPVDTVIG